MAYTQSDFEKYLKRDESIELNGQRYFYLRAAGCGPNVGVSLTVGGKELLVALEDINEVRRSMNARVN